MKAIRSILCAAMLLALLLFLPCGTALAEETGAIEYTGDPAALRKDLRALFESKCAEIVLTDATDAEFDVYALYDILHEESLRLAPEYSCIVASRFSYSDYFRQIYVPVSYLDAADLPQASELTTFYSGYTYTHTDSTGTKVTEKTFAGKRVLHVFGRTTCPNTQAFLPYLNAAANLLNDADVEVVIHLVDLTDETLPYYEELFSRHHCWKGDMLREWDVLEHFGLLDDGGYITFPVVLLADVDSDIIYCSSGYVNEPLQLIATAIKGKIARSNVLIIPASVTEIEAEAFMNCTDIVEVRFAGSNVTTIGERAFAGCTSLERITLPDGVTEIKARAFADCTSLLRITLPNTVTTLDRTAFRNCSSGLTVYCSRTPKSVWNNLYNENINFQWYD